MEKEQAREWAEAQAVTFSVDLVVAAKKVLKFLALVDQNRHLYDDNVLHRAVYRYNAFWLPLLAKHMENPVCGEEPLVVPLDCEWIWHCHRLNPLRYKSDCEKIFGKILSNRNTMSTAEATSKSATEEIWNKMYHGEPYELDMNRPFSGFELKNQKFTGYDLVAAVKRQISFTYQISRPYVTDDLYLQEAVARYKGFLHMVRTNDKRAVKCFCVPTYDVDLMWHTHQLHPDAYCKDLTAMVGRVLHHNDTVSDRSPGKPLYTGFAQITQLWDEVFGKSYWKAGTLHRGNSPSPVTHVPVKFDNRVVDKEAMGLDNCGNPIQLPSMKLMEVLLEFVEIKNIPDEHRGNLGVLFSKKQADRIFDTKRSLAISSESGEKNVASFQCEPTGELFFELMSSSPAPNETTPQKSMKLLGSCSFSLEELTNHGSELSADKWLSVQPVSGCHLSSDQPILLRARLSFTPPASAPQVFHLARSQCSSKADNAKTNTLVLDQVGKEVLSLQIRDATSDLVKAVYGITDSGEQHKLAEFLENHWVVKGSNGSFKLQNNPENDDVLFELVGSKMVKLYSGMRLDFETVPLENQKFKKGVVTAVEFSTEHPYGKVVALINLMSETVKATEDWMILPGLTLAFLLSDILKDKIKVVGNGVANYGDNVKMVKNGVLAQCGECRTGGDGGSGYATLKSNGVLAQCGECRTGGDGGSGYATLKSNGVLAQCGECRTGGDGGSGYATLKSNGVLAQCGECRTGGDGGSGYATLKRNGVLAQCGECRTGGDGGSGYAALKSNGVLAQCGECRTGGDGGSGYVTLKSNGVLAQCGECRTGGDGGSGYATLKSNRVLAQCGECRTGGDGGSGYATLKSNGVLAQCGECRTGGDGGSGYATLKSNGVLAQCGECRTGGDGGSGYATLKRNGILAQCGECRTGGDGGIGYATLKSNGVLAQCGECRTGGDGGSGYATLKSNGVLAQCGECRTGGDGGSGFATLTDMSAKDAFADCAKCYSCGVRAGGNDNDCKTDVEAMASGITA
ncbi:hypothetical protein vseg_015754 [Gypsophila vaccaria]